MRGTDRSRSASHRRGRLSRKGKVVAAAATVTVVAATALGYFTLFPKQAPAFVQETLVSVGLADPNEVEPQATCPLTGEVVPSGRVPNRPALAVKVENAPEARPQAALNDADIVVEEPVEGGYTRFIAIFQCGGSKRIGPIRSGRLTDPDYLRQLGPVVFGYAGGVDAVKRAVPRAGLVDVNYIVAARAYSRDETRAAPHNLYSTTSKLLRAAGNPSDAPAPLFSYSEVWEGRSRRARVVHLPYSSVSDVSWTWRPAKDAWFRAHGDVPHTLEGGDQVSGTNVVVQVVEVTDSWIVDAAGNASPDVELTGSGKAFVLRDGRVIVGRWERPTLDDMTTFVARGGQEITLARGRTWIQLLPSWVEIELSRR
jgi:Protein of unknown function (DUF3048) N-terminal domain/Protein of unknown function (DUF3048) C-terminal domain